MAYVPAKLFLADAARVHPQRAQFVKQLAENESFKLIQSRFDRIANKMLELCGHPVFDEYINHLLTDTRNGTRQGFPDEIGTALMRVNRFHNELMNS